MHEVITLVSRYPVPFSVNRIKRIKTEVKTNIFHSCWCGSSRYKRHANGELARTTHPDMVEGGKNWTSDPAPEFKCQPYLADIPFQNSLGSPVREIDDHFSLFSVRLNRRPQVTKCCRGPFSRHPASVSA